MRAALALLILAACRDNERAAPDAIEEAPFAAPVEILESAPGTSIEDVRAYAGELYWTEYGAEFNAQILARAADATTSRVIAALGGDGPPETLGVAGDHAVITWGDLGDCTVYAFSLDGGAARVLEAREETATCRVSTDGTMAAWSYVGIGALVQRARVDVDEAPTLLWSSANGRAGTPAVAGAETYWVGDGAIWRHDGISATQVIAGPVSFLEVEGDQLWWESEDRLFTAPLDALDGPATEVAADLPTLVDLAFDDAYVYALSTAPSSAASAILAISRDTGAPITLAAYSRIQDGRLRGLAAADGGVYYADNSPWDGDNTAGAIMFAARQ